MGGYLVIISADWEVRWVCIFKLWVLKLVRELVFNFYPLPVCEKRTKGQLVHVSFKLVCSVLIDFLLCFFGNSNGWSDEASLLERPSLFTVSLWYYQLSALAHKAMVSKERDFPSGIL